MTRSCLAPHLTSLLANVVAVTVRLQPIGSAPHLNQRVFKLSTNQRFETIVRFLRKRLGVKEHESVFCYIGSVFSPALDEGVGNLWTVSIQNACFGKYAKC
jgi:ubiquitin-like protein ATG12